MLKRLSLYKLLGVATVLLGASGAKADECGMYPDYCYIRQKVIDAATSPITTGYVPAGVFTSQKCSDKPGTLPGPPFCVYSIVKIYKTPAGLNAFFCEASTNGVAVNVGIVCTPDSLPGDMNLPTPAVGGAPLVAVTAGLMAPNRGLSVRASAITAGTSVVDPFYVPAP